MMDEMAKYGRYGDTMLVHMNPAEVAGIASLVPGGRLTTNPVTGQPEAFLPLLLGFAAKGLGLSALGTGALVGAGTAAVTGDLKRGILSGLTAGFGAGIADAAAGVGEAAQGIANVDPNLISDGAVALDAAGDVAQSVTQVDPNLISEGAVNIADATANVAQDPGMLDSIRSSVPDAFKSGTGVGEGISQNLGFSGNIAGAGIAAGTMEQDRLQEQFARQEMARLGEAEADRKEAYDDLQRGYMAAQPGIPTGLSGARSEMSRRTPPPMYMAGGGQVRGMEEGGKTYPGGQDENPYARQYASLGAARDIARFMGGPRGYMGVDPVTVQQRLRGPDVIAPPRDYMPGFEPEFDYFQNLARDPDGNIVGTPDVPDRSYRPMRQGVISRSQYFDPVLQAPQSGAQMNEFRRTLEKLDPGPLDEATVMGLASEGSVLSPMQQNMFQQYAPLAPFNTAQRGRISELMDRGMSMSQAIDNQQSSRVKGYDLDGDGVVTNAEFAQATAEPETPDMSGIDTEGMTEEQIALIQQYLDMYDPDTANFLTGMMTGGFGGIFNYMNKGGEAEGKKMPEVGPAPTGGDIPIRTSMMEGTVPDGGIARVPTEFTQQAMPSEQEMSMLAMAVLGQTENPDPIINMFVDKYGPDMFRQVRQMILESVVPNAQTEGMVRGNGSGMDDKVQGMIGKDQPVAVSPGEYIVAADVVSGLGEGSSDAGAKELDRMMDKVRMERNGTTQQAPRIDERKVMPA
jgi:hypothetical protein